MTRPGPLTIRSVFTFLVILVCLVSDGSSNAQEPSAAQMSSSTPDVTASPETTAQPNPRDLSPDNKWEFFGGDEAKIVKADTNQAALDLSNCGRGSPLWAPDSKRFALNCWQGPRYQDTSLYQLRGGEWKTLRSPYDGVREILNKVIAAQVKKAGLPKKTDLRLIWQTYEVRRWVDSNTAILYASLHQVVRENPETRFDVEFFFTLKFSAEGNWKVVKSHQLSDEEIDKEQ